ncbi:hypothetical protein M4D51_12640 [Microbacterium sp. p3-SID338]|uniref:hypothetical protein n=1 Tax=unclassified Microbacterium TaxID=2609290 RepID=UPI000C80FC11|nr:MULTISPECIES: hypothetical protein [unclassified Microbacterium]MCT1396572.1 hypothetical protein [Microbacterium sp. p3-SID338]PMC02467.1 hypothetical protein CJ226_13790 [Microbacterium sp. UMB0228]
MERESLGNGDHDDRQGRDIDPNALLLLGTRAASRALQHVVSPWWVYVLTAVIWGAAFSVVFATKAFWVIALALAAIAPVVTWLKTRVTGVKISDRMQLSAVRGSTVGWLVAAIGVYLVLLMLGTVWSEFYGWGWAQWVLGALVGPVWAFAEWRIDVGIRKTLLEAA